MFRLFGRAGILSLVAFVLPACGAEMGASRALGTIEGRVALGPIMPVCQEGVPCDGVVVRDKSGDEVARTTADDKGEFRVDVSAGARIVGVSVKGPMPSCRETEVVVVSGQSVRADLDCDSGIR
jgi:hypothetical protein